MLKLRSSLLTRKNQTDDLHHLQELSVVYFLSLLTLVAILGTAPAFGQTSSEVDIQAGAGSSASAACTTTNNCFSPNPITVAPGTEVEWKNEDTVSHTVTSGKNLDDPNLGSVFDSGLIKNGAEFKFTFANAGTYDYLCSVHPWMTGQIIVGGSSNNIPPPSNSQIVSVSTDLPSYKQGDTIVISGRVDQINSNAAVTLRIFNSHNNLLAVSQILPSSDGTFTKTLLTVGPLWADAGTFTIVAQYGPSSPIITTTFQFSGSATIQSGNNMKVDGTNLYAKYSITNGNLLGIKADIQTKSLIASIQTTGDGVLTITLPRALIDATLQTGQDDKYYVLVNGQESDFQEISTTTTDRTLSIPFTGGTDEIEIIGTTIITSSSPNYSSSEVDIQAGAGSSASAACTTTNNCFSPNPITVAPGTEVEWKNEDTVSHTVTSGKNLDDPNLGSVFDSGLIKNGAEFKFTFANAGTYDYLCSVHPWMTGQVIVTGTTYPQPQSTTLSVITDKSSYNQGDMVTTTATLGGTSSNQNVAISVTDPSGNIIVSRVVSTSYQGVSSIQFKIPATAQIGTYQVIATSSTSGNNLKQTTKFIVNSQYQVSIVSVQATDQQGNSLTSFTRGGTGYVKVVIQGQSNQNGLITINLFDSDSTSIGIGSLKGSIANGQSEIVLSFSIPKDAVVGNANIYADIFSDYPSKGGTPLTSEISSTVGIQ